MVDYNELDFAERLIQKEFKCNTVRNGESYVITCLVNDKNINIAVKGRKSGICWIEVLYNNGQNGWIASDYDYIGFIDDSENLLLVSPKKIREELLPKVKWYDGIDFSKLFNEQESDIYVSQLINYGFIKYKQPFDFYELRRRSGNDKRHNLPYKDLMFKAQWDDVRSIADYVLKE